MDAPGGFSHSRSVCNIYKQRSLRAFFFAAGNRTVSCAQLRRKGYNITGDYVISPHTNFYVSCDMDTDGGGWTVSFSTSLRRYTHSKRTQSAISFFILKENEY